jgi:hypothetical protein
MTAIRLLDEPDGKAWLLYILFVEQLMKSRGMDIENPHTFWKWLMLTLVV